MALLQVGQKADDDDQEHIFAFQEALKSKRLRKGFEAFW